jgi:hypothetical protein
MYLIIDNFGPGTYTDPITRNDFNLNTGSEFNNVSPNYIWSFENKFKNQIFTLQLRNIDIVFFECYIKLIGKFQIRFKVQLEF